MNILDQIMGVKEAGEMWGLSPDRVKGLCQKGEVKCKKIGWTWVLVKNQPNPKRRDFMKTWEREGYKVKERKFDHDLYVFDVIKNEEVIATILPPSIEDMKQIIEDLDNGEDVDGWEDGKGNTISI
jgi:hypothetical protein